MVTHIGPGGPGPCGANSGPCPFGEENHYATAAEAKEVWEATMAEKHPPVTLRRESGFSQRKPNSYEQLQEAKSLENSALAAKMEEKFGPHWSASMDNREVHHGYTYLSGRLEDINRELAGLRFSQKEGEITDESLLKEKAILTDYLESTAGARWDDWEEQIDEPEFYREYGALNDRRLELNEYLDGR